LGLEGLHVDASLCQSLSKSVNPLQRYCNFLLNWIKSVIIGTVNGKGYLPDGNGSCYLWVTPKINTKL